MKSVLISIRPKWIEKIASGEKTIEVRKTAPKEVPFKAYIYETKESKRRYLDDRFNSFLDNKSHYTDMGKVIGEFVCDKVYLIKNQGSRSSVADEEQSVTNEIARQGCLDYDDMVSYLGNKDGYGLHITDLKIYDNPKELREFYYCCKEMKANEPRAGKYISLSCYACRHNALKRTEDCSEYNNMLGYICKRNITRPPQSWQFVEELKE